MQDAGYKPGVRVFRSPGSVFGARCSVLGVDRVPGPRCPVPDTWYPVPNPVRLRRPDTERRGPRQGTGYWKTRTWGLHSFLGRAVI
jgi:hypothetical protein